MSHIMVLGNKDSPRMTTRMKSVLVCDRILGIKGVATLTEDSRQKMSVGCVEDRSLLLCALEPTSLLHEDSEQCPGLDTDPRELAPECCDGALDTSSIHIVRTQESAEEIFQKYSEKCSGLVPEFRKDGTSVCIPLQDWQHGALEPLFVLRIGCRKGMCASTTQGSAEKDSEELYECQPY